MHNAYITEVIFAARAGLEPVTSAVVGDTRFELVRGVLNIHFAL